MDGHLATYLNDHLAGATAGIEIAQYLIDHSGDAGSKEMMLSIKAEIEKDHQTLRSLMVGLKIDESETRKATGWLSEKGTEIKLRFDDPSGGELRAFEALELLSLGIEGKRCLWRALGSIAASDPGLDALDLDAFVRRAEEQRQVVEELRLSAARKALTLEEEG